MTEVATTPPMGWNSWDCFGVSVTEAEVKANADFMAARLKQYGWEYVVVDLGWYAPSADKDNYKEPGIKQLIDGYGRLIPCPKKFPSSAGGKGFKPLADYLHGLGLKFGIHIMRGIPWQATKQDTPILRSAASARNIAQPDDICPWYKGMHGVNMTRDGAQEYYDSLLQMYAKWEVDFIKADDINSWDGGGMVSPYHTDEIEGLSQAIRNCGRPIVLSLSPGAALVCNARHLRKHANMWRISSDFWDDWEALKRQFERCKRWAPYVTPGHWPDADMLPIGGVGIRGEIGESRSTNFTEAERYTLMTLWCIFRSPLMYGGHLPESDPLALSLVTNQEIIAVNQHSANNHEVFRTDNKAAWLADAPNSDGKYLALFNLADEVTAVTLDFASARLSANCYAVRDLWKHEDLGVHAGSFSRPLPVHGARLYRLSGQ